MSDFLVIVGVICIISVIIFFYRKTTYFKGKEIYLALLFIFIGIFLSIYIFVISRGSNFIDYLPPSIKETPTIIQATPTPQPTVSHPSPTPTLEPTLPPISQPTSIPTHFPAPAPILIVNLSPSEVQIITDAPTLMQINQSYEVKVSLIPKGKHWVSKLTIEKATAVPSETIPIGTPGATLQNAFGSSSQVDATATLSPSYGPFKINPIGPEEQPLDQPSIIWKWIVIPLEPGDQIMDVNIEATWTSSNKHAYDARIGDDQILIRTSEPPVPTPAAAPPPTPVPLVTFGQVNITSSISSLVLALISAGALVPFVSWLWKRRQSKTTPPANTKKNTKRRKRP